MKEVRAEQIDSTAATWSSEQLKGAVRSFIEDFSIEATPHALSELASYPQFLAPGTTVYAAHPPKASLDDVVDLAVRLQGMVIERSLTWRCAASRARPSSLAR